ncbi:SRPBCC family protein [Haloarcula litorea]|uniref:SRPBCC family protein n=1 Tax=Haloarcula litorea TaxID=3032579 RepID=UPI0023E8CB26|nr:SRPBCC family protein [Halomicroarcula sp. GDY20]
MASVTVSRTFDADPGTVRAAMSDTAAFMRGAGFDGVEYDGDRLHIENRVGMFDIELELDVLDTDAALAYEQVEGVFESMRTEYRVEGEADGTTVTATTDYESTRLAVVGSLLDESVVQRQRRKELAAQFDWLAERVE